jgi:hypothetical protein
VRSKMFATTVTVDACCCSLSDNGIGSGGGAVLESALPHLSRLEELGYCRHVSLV